MSQLAQVFFRWAPTKWAPRFHRNYTQQITRVNWSLLEWVEKVLVNGVFSSKEEAWPHGKLSKLIHPRRLTQNLKMDRWKMIFLFQGCLLRFHVNLPGCTLTIENIESKWPDQRQGWPLKLIFQEEKAFFEAVGRYRPVSR